MSKPKVVVTRRWPEEVERRLVELFDAELNSDDRPLAPAGLKAAFAEADARHRRRPAGAVGRRAVAP